MTQVTRLGQGGYPRGRFYNQFTRIVIVPPPSTRGDLFQLDQGLPYQGVQTYLGPTLGWVQNWVRPERTYTSSPINVTSRDSVILIDEQNPVTVNLPDVSAWMREPFYQIYSPFERAIWIKDIGGYGGAFNITIVPFGSQTIDGQPTFVMVMNRAIARLYPRNDLTGWYSG
jgi:hypothetical protein